MSQKTRSELADKHFRYFLSNPHTTSIQMFVEDVGDINYRSDGGRTILHHLSGSGYSGRVLEFCKNGANPNIIDDEQKTALCYAIINRMPISAIHLLKYGADSFLPKADWCGFSSALELAKNDEYWHSSSEYIDVVKFMQEQEATHLDSKPASKRK